MSTIDWDRDARRGDAELADSYEETPYVSRAFWYTHPDALGTVATLAGMKPAPVTNCRVLELGCASGGNILPMAEALPQSSFVGVDLAARQVEVGQKIADAAGLRNCRLAALSILDIPDEITPEWGEFDYIIAHGVYSWVPPAVQQKIFRICNTHLAPHGVAYISYNTYPGWHQRAMVREMMQYHVQGIEKPEQRAAQALALVHFLHDNAPPGSESFRAAMREELKHLQPSGLYYLLHEHLEPFNQPVYFHEFIGAATQHGLQYLGESRQVAMRLTPEAQKVLAQLAGDPLRVEQYLDFLLARKFRWTALVRQGVSLHTLDPEEAVRRVRIAGRLETDPKQINPAQLESAEPITFLADDGDVQLKISDPPTKRAFAALNRAWPRTLSFAEIWKSAGGESAVGECAFARFVLQAFLKGIVEMHIYDAPFATRVSERPAASLLKRICAANGLPVTNARHYTLGLTDFQRLLLGYLDGERGRGELLAALQADCDSGDLQINEKREGDTPVDPAAARQFLESQLDNALAHFSSGALLMP